MNLNILGKLPKNKKITEEDIFKVLLSNRGIKKEDVEEFLHPKDPTEFSLEELGVSKAQLQKALLRVKKAQESGEHVIVYGDYDADGICATAILWERLYSLKLNCLPYIPDRFTEGYGLNPKSVEKIKEKDSAVSLIITVDNGIVAVEAIKKAKELGIDVIVSDHHLKGEKKNEAFAILHTTSLSGAGISYFLANRIEAFLKGKKVSGLEDKHSGLDLAAIGSVSDQMPVVGVNRSIISHGLVALDVTKRIGLQALMHQAGIEKVGVYEIGYLIAPRLNATGRMGSAINSLRLVCTRDPKKARELSTLLGKTNQERQDVVEKVLTHAKEKAEAKKDDLIVVVSDESFHEGVIGLAAGKIVEEYYKPAIVFSVKEKISKASARSISGFNIIEAIRKVGDLLIEGGGHAMAAGFTVYTKDIGKFTKKINEIAKKVITKEMLQRKINVDLEIGFPEITKKLVEDIQKLEPFGIGNPTPVFLTTKTEIKNIKVVGREGKHLKFTVGNEDDFRNAIAFGKSVSDVPETTLVAIIYSVEENAWNGKSEVQLKVKNIM